MKKKQKPLFLLVAVIMLQSFIQLNAQEVKTIFMTEYHELKPNEVDSFADGPDNASPKQIRRLSRASNDGTGFQLEQNTAGNIKVSDLRECKGKYQNELNMLNAKGTITESSDTVVIAAKTVYNKFYIFNVAKKGIYESFAPDVRIQLICRTLSNTYCPAMLDTDGRISIVALPKDVDTEDLYEPFHLDKNVGIFSYFAVYDSNGKFKVFPQGDYVLIGGNSLKISK